MRIDHTRESNSGEDLPIDPKGTAGGGADPLAAAIKHGGRKCPDMAIGSTRNIKRS